MTIKINGTNTTAQPSITGTDTDTGLVYGDNDVKIVTGGTDRLTVNGTGILLLNTAVVGSRSSNAHLNVVSGSNGWGLTLRNRSNNDYAFQAFNSHDNSEQLASIALQRTGTNLGDLFFSTNGGNASATERMRILSSGGITFNGDTASANALDDYEEGSWTPTDSLGVGITITLAKYTKIGQFVYCDLDITYDSNSTGGNARLSLPFSMITASEYGSGIAGWSSNADGCKLHIGGETVYLMKLETNSSIGNAHLSPADMSNKRIISSFTYRAA